MDLLAVGVLAVMREAGVDKATFVGHSMGAAVISRVYQQAPEKVAGLVAVDGALRRQSVTAQQSERYLAPLRTPEYREHTKKFISSKFPVPGR